MPFKKKKKDLFMYTVVLSACTSAEKMVSDPKILWDYSETLVNCHVGTELRTSAEQPVLLNH